MKNRRAHRPRVTNAVPVSGLAVLAMALVPHHAATAPHAAGVTTAGTGDVPAAVDAYRVKALVAAGRHRQDAALPVYAVRAGDSLSAIASRHCGGQADRWTGIYAASHLKGSANLIQPGEELTLDCTYVPAELGKAAAPHPEQAAVAAVITTSGHHDPFDGHHGDCGDGDEDGMDASCSVIFPTTHGGSHAVTVVRSSGSMGNVNPGSFSGFEQCVITRESGGNSQVMNSSGHYGLFQFSESTWEAYGGSASTFGHATAAQQEAVFNTAIAQGGQSNWSPYDGC